MDKLVKLRYWWFALSLVIIIPGLVSLAIFGLRLGIDFSGGALWDIQFVERAPGQLDTERICAIFAAQGFEGALVQLTESQVDGRAVASAVVRTRSLSETDPEAQRQRVLSALSAEYGTVNQQAL